MAQLDHLDEQGLDGWYSSVVEGRTLTVALADDRGLRHLLETTGIGDLLEFTLKAIKLLQVEVERESSELSELALTSF